MDGFARDVRFAFRGFLRQPAFATLSISAVGIGAGTLASVLSVVFAVLIRPAPYPTSSRIVQIAQSINGRNTSEASTADILALRERSGSLSHVTLAWFSEANVSGDGVPDRARLVYTDWHAFDLLGVRPLLGRLPSAEDEASGAEPVVVIGHRLWAERFASSRDAVGRSLRVDGQQYTIIAVMPPAFRFPAPYWAAGDLWLLRGPSHPAWPASRARNVLAFGLMKTDASRSAAQAEADVIASALDERYPNPGGKVGLRLTGWAEPVISRSRPRVLFVLGLAVVVFLIVTANVMNLALSRGLERQREFAARVALGAGGARLARQLITENIVMFSLGGLLGLLFASWGSRLIVAMRSYQIPRMDEAVVDGTVAAATMISTLTAGIIVALVSAMQARTARLPGLADSAVRGGSYARRWRTYQRTLVTIEVALALVLVTDAGVLLDGARKLARIEPGFDAHGLLHARVSLPPEKYKELPTQIAFYDRLLERLGEIPGVSSACLVNVPPGVGGDARPSVVLDSDRTTESNPVLRAAHLRVVTERYFETLGVRALAGSAFPARDAHSSPLVVVNEAFVRRYLGGEPAIGRQLRVAFGAARELDAVPRTIAGVVPDIREKTLYEPAPPVVYIPLEQSDWRVGLRMALLMRGTRSSGGLIPEVRAAVASADAEQAAYGFMPLADLMASELSLNRLTLALLGVLATFGLFLAIVGVYGMAMQSVRQRTREIGIRMALGDSPAGILRLVLRDGVIVSLAGILSGAVLSFWTARLLRAVVNGIDQTNPTTFVAAAAVLATAVFAGCYVPARRASHIDPATVLRSV
jgi:predicted permease